MSKRWLSLSTACGRVVYSYKAAGVGGWRAQSAVRYAANTPQVHTCHPAASTRLLHTGVNELYNNRGLQRFLQQLLEEHRDLSLRLQQADLTEADRKELARRHAELLPVAAGYERTERAQRDLDEVVSLLNSELSCLNKGYIYLYT